MPPTYDPKARFDISVFEEPLRKTAKGRQLMARIYQVAGTRWLPSSRRDCA